MADTVEKRAMDAKLTKVWSSSSGIDLSESQITRFKTRMSPERLDSLASQQQEAAERVFKPLKS